MLRRDGERVSVQLAQLRGELGTSLADIKGSLGVLVDRTNRTDSDVRQLRMDTDADIAAIRTDVDELQRGRWPLAQIGAGVAVATLLATGATLLTR